MALTTLIAVKQQAGISLANTSRDAQILSMISGITSMVQQSLHRDIEAKTYTEYHSGDNSAVLQLRQYPIISVTTVCLDDNGWSGEGVNAFPVENNLTQGVGYSIMAGAKGIGSSGCLRRIGNVWWNYPTYAPGFVAPQPSAPRDNIKVVYRAGYQPIPPAIEFAINSAIVRAMSAAALGGPVQSESYEDASVSFLSPSDMAKVFGSVERSLGSFRRPVV